NFAGDSLQEPHLHLLHGLWCGMFAPVLQARLQVEQAYPGIDDLPQLLTCRIAGLARRLDKGLGEPGDHLRIDRIVLGEPPGRAGEAAHLLRVDDADLEAGLAQRLGPVLLVAAGRLHGRLADLVLAKAGDQLAPSLWTTRKRL